MASGQVHHNEGLIFCLEKRSYIVESEKGRFFIYFEGSHLITFVAWIILQFVSNRDLFSFNLFQGFTEISSIYIK